jgi:hypothetical protein
VNCFAFRGLGTSSGILVLWSVGSVAVGGLAREISQLSPESASYGSPRRSLLALDRRRWGEIGSGPPGVTADAAHA